MTKSNRKSAEARTISRLAREAIEGNKRLARKAKPTKVVELPAAPKVAKGSVVPAFFKAKANKQGVMKQDDLDQAVRNAFLAEGSSELTPAQSARIACDNILAENQLDVGRWAGKNPGMLSMNLRNVLRGIRRNGESVMVRSKAFKAEPTA